MRFFLCSVLLLLLGCCSYAQQDAITDQALLKIQQVKNDTLRMDSMYHYINRHQVFDHPKEAVTGGKILLEDASTHNYRRGMGNADMVIAGGYENRSDFPQSLKYYLDALEIFKDLKLYPSQVFALLGVSRVYEVTNDFAKEKEYVRDAVAICEQNKTDKRIEQMQPGVLDYLATMYKKEARYDTTEQIYNQAIALARKVGDSEEVMNSLCNLATALKSDKKFEQSLATYNQVFRLLDTAKQRYSYAVIADDMSILFYQMGDLKRSEQYAFKSLSAVSNSSTPDVQRDVYETLKGIYEKEKRYPEALDYFAKWSAIKDTILNREKSQQITEWQAKFDSEAKDKEIAVQKKQLAYNLKINLALIVCVTLLLLLGLIIYRSYNAQRTSNLLLSKEKKRSEDLLLNILPSEVADELKDKGFADAKYFDNVTVVFTDFVNFTKASERMSPQQLIDELHYYFKAFDEIIDKYNIEKIKTIGDSYLAVSGLPVPDARHAENIVRAAIEINNFVNRRKQQVGDATFEVRIGIHSGSVVAGIVGVKKFSYDIWGDTVNTAARMEQNSEPGKINISETTYVLVKDKFNCTYRGEIEAKNKGFMKMYFVQV